MNENIGNIVWFDLTVKNADEVRDFYSEVVGWKPVPVDMKGYNDYSMNRPSDDNAVAGVCHNRGVNADLPPQWLIYIIVEDVDKSAAKVVELGGKLISEPKNMGKQARYCVIQDPAGAVAALYQEL